MLTVVHDGLREAFEVQGTPTLAEALRAHGFAMPTACGGMGRCGRCRIEATGALSPLSEAERRHGFRLACRTTVQGDCTVILPQKRPMEQLETGGFEPPLVAPMEGSVGAAIDIGTTTLAVKAYDLQTGALLHAGAAVNPQTSMATDVMGRIGLAIQGEAKTLQRQIEGALGLLLPSGVPIRSLVVTGNTAMLYLLTGRSPETLAHAPFEADCLFGCETVLLNRACYLPPCMNAFVGADIACGALACGLCDREETSLLLDVGTNGEIALRKNGRLFVTSAAAGPAFESGGAEMGCGSVRGAIDRVWTEGGSLGVHTIGDAEAVGLCGSGLIDALAALRQAGRIDETGLCDAERLWLTSGVYLSQKDVRAMQLAKAAISAGLRRLLEQADTSAAEVRQVYLAGGFGSRLNLASAAAVGLIPRVWVNRTRAVGNAALSGAAMLLLNTELRAKVERIAAASEHVALGGDERFAELFLNSMALCAN